MRDWIIKSDNCGRTIKGHPIMVTFVKSYREEYVEMDDAAAKYFDLCEECARHIGAGLTGARPEEDEADAAQTQQEQPETQQSEADAAQAQQEEPAAEKKKPGKRLQIDEGKLLALYEAGWTNRAIAEEFGVTTQTITNHLKSLLTENEVERTK